MPKKRVGIRALTCFAESKNLEMAFSLMRSANVIEERGYSIRTKRVSLIDNAFEESMIEMITEELEDNSIWGFSVGLDNPNDKNQLNMARRILEQTENGFVNFNMRNDDGFDSNAVKNIVELIEDNSKRDSGINNFRLGISFGLDEPTPFFPYSKHDSVGFAIGLEYVDLIMHLINENSRKSLSDVQKEISRVLEEEFRKIGDIGKSIERETGIEFIGIDLSLAPYPYPLEDQSVVEIIETLGNIAKSRGDLDFRFGMSGTLFLHTFITQIIKRIASSPEIRTTGFNGIMYSVLEDSRLSNRFSRNDVSTNLLLLTSTTCGCGIDMVPMTEKGSSKAIAGMIWDIYALSRVLEKPLGIRVLPVPNSRAGDFTDFKHLFFSNTRLQDTRGGISYHDLPGQKTDPRIDIN